MTETFDPRHRSARKADDSLYPNTSLSGIDQAFHLSQKTDWT
jgi:hypothetical protein